MDPALDLWIELSSLEVWAQKREFICNRIMQNLQLFLSLSGARVDLWEPCRQTKGSAYFTFLAMEDKSGEITLLHHPYNSCKGISIWQRGGRVPVIIDYGGRYLAAGII